MESNFGAKSGGIKSRVAKLKIKISKIFQNVLGFSRIFLNFLGFKFGYSNKISKGIHKCFGSGNVPFLYQFFWISLNGVYRQSYQSILFAPPKIKVRRLCVGGVMTILKKCKKYSEPKFIYRKLATLFYRYSKLLGPEFEKTVVFRNYIQKILKQNFSLHKKLKNLVNF